MNTSSIEGWTTSTKLKEIEGGSSSSEESSDDESDTSTDSSSVAGSETETIQLFEIKKKVKKSRKTATGEILILSIESSSRVIFWYVDFDSIINKLLIEFDLGGSVLGGMLGEHEK